jgi:hypothetical protein
MKLIDKSGTATPPLEARCRNAKSVNGNVHQHLKSKGMASRRDNEFSVSHWLVIVNDKLLVMPVSHPSQSPISSNNTPMTSRICCLEPTG